MTRRPRVLIIGPVPPPYLGPAVNTRALLGHPALHERFDVLHLDTSDRRDITNSGRFDLTNVKLALQHGARFVAMLARHSPDLIYLPISPSTLGLVRDLEFLLPAAATRTTIVIHQRGGEMHARYLGANVAVRAALRFAFSRISRVIVLGEHFRPDFRALIDSERVAVVYNGVDPTPWTSHVRPVRDRVRVLYMGILMEPKGYRLVLEAARRLRGEPIVFQFAGELMSDAERTYTEHFVRDHGLDVEFLGVVAGADKIDLLSSADIFAFPTAYRWEGHPTVLVEAMAAGLAIVATRHVAIPETIADGRDGLLIDVGDVDALTMRIRQLAGDAGLRARLGAHARATMMERFTLDRCVRSIVSVFDAALEDPR